MLDWVRKFLAKLRRTGPSPAVRARVRPANSYHAVSVEPGMRVCRGHAELHGRRFLAREAPRLPLASCELPQCRCRFRHHPDRRAEPRRAIDFGHAASIAAHASLERRARRRGRRADE